MKQKIFGVGFQKTGTKSLHEALRLLGLKSEHGIRINKPRGVTIEPPITTEKILPIAMARIPHADAFSDMPWPLLYVHLHQKHPDAKFILTTRDPQQWIKSALGHFGPKYVDVHEWIYGVGVAEGNEKQWLDVYNAHNESVREYFREAPANFIEINVDKGLAWQPLCKFLELPVPNSDFPHRNTAAERQKKRQSTLRRLKSWLPLGRAWRKFQK